MQCSSADRIESDLRQEWVELTPFELRRLCADCREKKLEEARGFLLRLASSNLY